MLASCSAMYLSRVVRYSARRALKRSSVLLAAGENSSSLPPASTKALRSASTAARRRLLNVILMASTTGRSLCTGFDASSSVKRAISSSSPRSVMLSLMFSISRSEVSSSVRVEFSSLVSAFWQSSAAVCGAWVVVSVSSATVLMPTSSSGAVRLVFSVALVK